MNTQNNAQTSAASNSAAKDNALGQQGQKAEQGQPKIGPKVEGVAPASKS